MHIHLFENLCWTLVVPWLYIIRYKINTQCFLAGFWPPHPYTDLACGRNRHLWQPGGRRPRRGRGSRSRDQPQLGRGRPKSSSFLRCLTAWIWGTINWHQTIYLVNVFQIKERKSSSKKVSHRKNQEMDDLFNRYEIHLLDNIVSWIKTLSPTQLGPDQQDSWLVLKEGESCRGRGEGGRQQGVARVGLGGACCRRNLLRPLCSSLHCHFASTDHRWSLLCTFFYESC